MNRFKQSVIFKHKIEQQHYDQVRTLLKDDSSMLSGIISHINNNPQDLLINKDKFLEIIQIAKQDYREILLNPYGFIIKSNMILEKSEKVNWEDYTKDIIDLNDISRASFSKKSI